MAGYLSFTDNKDKKLLMRITGGCFKGVREKVLRKIFTPRRLETQHWRKLHNEELHNLYPI
jgi:hypothetical protein